MSHSRLVLAPAAAATRAPAEGTATSDDNLSEGSAVAPGGQGPSRAAAGPTGALPS